LVLSAFAAPFPQGWYAQIVTIRLSVGCIGLIVSDLDRSADFYNRVLSFEKASAPEITEKKREGFLGDE